MCSSSSSSSSVLVVVLLGMVLEVLDGVHIKRIPVVSVTGLTGGAASLPCDVTHSPGDAIYLLLWFREPLTTPIYRLDERWQGQEEEKHWSDEQQLGSRASLEVGPSRAVLRLTSLTKADQGLYTCRVDFKLRPTETTRVSLTVVVPPESVSVVEGGQESPRGANSIMVGPYLEGDTPSLTCVARGGSPRPSVLWYKDAQLLDGYMESGASGNSTEDEGHSAEDFAILDLIVPTTTMLDQGQTITTLDSGPAAAAATTITLDLDLEFTTLDSGLREKAPVTMYGDEPFNTVTLGPLSRNDLQLVLTCEAFNNNITRPSSMAVVVDMNLPPLMVEIQPLEEEALRADATYQVTCEVVGARPPPVITWWAGYLGLHQAQVTTSADGNVTTSTLYFTPRPDDHGSNLRCVAETFTPPAVMEDSFNMTVFYVPVASCSFGSSLVSSNIKEGDDVYFECSVNANPPVSRVSWRHNNKRLDHNVLGGVIISGWSLVLQRVVRAQAGRYTCHPHNPVGVGASNSITLDVKYAPVCSPGQVTTYAVGRYEDAEVTCSVDANPIQKSFQWTFNNTADTIDVPPGRYTSTKSHSVITYTPMTSLDYGTLLCWATNIIGVQREPCVFHIVPAGKPEPPSKCRVGRGTPTSVRVACEAGSSGGLTQHFTLYARLQQGDHILNFTTHTLPVFQVDGLKVGGRYYLTITAVNAKGASEAVLLTITSGSSNSSVYQLYDGPSEAEVRDGGKIVSPEDTEEPEDDIIDHRALGSLVIPSLLLVVLGVGSGFVFLVIVLLLFITFRSRRAPQLLSLAVTHHHKEMVDHHHHSGKSPRSSRTSSTLTPDRESSCLERDMQVETESDADPDVIPLHQCHSDGGEGASQLVPPPATLLPTDGYKYPSYVTSQGLGRHSSTRQQSKTTSSAVFRTPGSFTGCYYARGYLHYDPPYVQEATDSSSLSLNIPVIPPTATTSVCQTSVLGTQQFPCLDSNLPPPMADYLGSDRKRVSFARHLNCDDDAPSTPLLKKGESCV